MSTEIAKKRGRPKKVISDPLEPQLSETTKNVRSKSTKAAPKASKASKSTTAKSTSTSKPATKSSTTSATSVKAKSVPPPLTTSTAQSSSTSPKSPVLSTTPPSTISDQVRSLSAKNGNESFAPKAEAPQGRTTPSSNPSSSAPSTSSASDKPPSASSANGAPKPKIPLAEMNSEIVSRITTRAGARPNAARNKALPPNYKSVARRVTMVIVAIPLSLVTSYVLFQRLGPEDPLNLLRPAVAKSEGVVGEQKKSEGGNASR